MDFNNPKNALLTFFEQKKQSISSEIGNVSNDIIMANSVEEIVENLNASNQINIIELLDSEANKQIRQDIFKKL